MEYVLDEKNQHAMKSIVESANLWCKQKNSMDQLTKDAVFQLKKYESAINAYDANFVTKWKVVHNRIWSNIGEDLVDCSF